MPAVREPTAGSRARRLRQKACQSRPRHPPPGRGQNFPEKGNPLSTEGKTRFTKGQELAEKGRSFRKKAEQLQKVRRLAVSARQDATNPAAPSVGFDDGLARSLAEELVPHLVQVDDVLRLAEQIDDVRPLRFSFLPNRTAGSGAAVPAGSTGLEGLWHVTLGSNDLENSEQRNLILACLVVPFTRAPAFWSRVSTAWQIASSVTGQADIELKGQQLFGCRGPFEGADLSSSRRVLDAVVDAILGPPEVPEAFEPHLPD